MHTLEQVEIILFQEEKEEIECVLFMHVRKKIICQVDGSLIVLGYTFVKLKKESVSA